MDDTVETGEDAPSPAVPASAVPAPAVPVEYSVFLQDTADLATYLFRAGLLFVFLEQRKQAKDWRHTPGRKITPGLPRLGRRLTWDLAGWVLKGLGKAASEAVMRSTWRSFKSSGLLFATIVIVFFTGDTWRILGTNLGWRFWSLLGLFLVLGVGLVAKGSTWWNDLAPREGTPRPNAELAAFRDQWSARGVTGAYSGKGDAAAWGGVGTARAPNGDGPVAAAGEGAPTDRGAPPDAPVYQRAWLRLLYFANIAMYVWFGAFWVAVALVVVGVIRFDAATTASLMGTGPGSITVHVLWWHHLPGGIVVTEQLLLVAATLGGLAALYTAVSLQDDEATEKFVEQALGGLKDLVQLYSVYRQAWDEVGRIVGADRDPAARPPAGLRRARRGTPVP